jgi:hypothetical protein
MGYGLEIAPPLATVILLLPLAALATVLVLAVKRAPAARRKSASSDATAAGGLGRYGEPLATERPLTGELATRIARARARGDERELLALHLENARAKREQGRLAEAAESLRHAIRIASRIGNAAGEAQARLDLGDLERASGDLTSACEHWQIARRLFFELKQSRDLNEAETRMREHGCPTDWVLNDF